MIKGLKDIVFSFGGYFVFICLLIYVVPALLVNAYYQRKMVSGVIIEHSVTSTRSGNATYNTLVRYDNEDLGLKNETDMDLYVMAVGTKVYKEKWVYKK
jgi:hypothetical protein